MHIHIIGGGIGGLTTAIALQKKGFQVRVSEAAPELRPVGAGIIMASNAMQIAQRLGYYEEVLRAGNPLSWFGAADHLGKALQVTDIARIAAQYGAPSVAIHRGALQQVLLRQLLPDTLVLNRRFEAIEKQDAGGVRVRFADGSTEESDLLIGADGIRSRVRKALFGEIPLRYSGQTCWRGILPHRLAEVSKGVELWGKTGGKRIALIQIGENQVYFYFTLKAKAGQSFPNDRVAEFLQEQLREFPAEYAEIIGKAQPADIFHDDLHDLPRLAQWHQGSVLLIGDAAHATTPNLGQGGCQAVEDGYALAECLATQPNPSLAFTAFEKQRREKVDYVVNTSFLVGQLSNIGGPLLWPLRNAMLRATPASVGEAQIGKLMQL
ncbi:MAG: monooxygenase [Bacteroidetes bacterium]|nr:MAG: monooxygenase [Bacteroidota bacterium]